MAFWVEDLVVVAGEFFRTALKEKAIVVRIIRINAHTHTHTHSPHHYHSCISASFPSLTKMISAVILKIVPIYHNMGTTSQCISKTTDL